MNRKLLVLSLMVTAAASPVLADYAHDLQFTNLTLNAALSVATQTNPLNSVAYGSSSNFVAVGGRQVFVNGNFAPGQNWFTPANWNTGTMPTSGGMAGSNLTAVAAGGNLFVAGGDNNWIFTSTNGVIWSTNNNKVFINNVFIGGLAYNGGNFVAAGKGPEISYTNNLPKTAPWNASTITNLSFLESYRGVTPYGTNGFAVCGVLGVVRFSADAGKTWQQPVSGGVNQPNFYGIATDGTNTLVCVGVTNIGIANGVIMVSTNRGSTWQVAASSPAAASPINSVAYTGKGFVAVGNNGQVLTSTNGVNWVVVPPASIPFAHVSSATNLNLNGVTFATGGYMHDVGEIVGASGNVIITAPPPPTNNSLGNKWICVGVTDVIQVGTNTGLPANTLQVTNAWGTNAVAVDWYDAPVGGNQIINGVFITNGMFGFTPPFITDNSDNYTNTYYAQARDLRTGFVNTNRTAMTLTNFMRPTAALITTNTICNGDTTSIQAKLAGNGPWTVYWKDGFTFFTNTVGGSGVYYHANPYVTTLNLPNAAFNPTNLFLNTATNHNYWVWKLSDSYFPVDDPTNLNTTGTNWSGDLVGTDLVTVNPRPTAAVVTTNTICNGDVAVLQANLTGIGPWTVYWTDGFSNYTQNVNVNGAGPYADYLTIRNSAFNPTNVFLNAITNHSYWVFAVSDTNCAANSSDISGVASITVNPRPTATLVTTNTICNGDATTIQANLTGIGPWTVYWTDGISNFTQTVSVNAAGPYVDVLTIPNGVFNPTNLFLNAATNHHYWVTSVADSNCVTWASDITGTNLITVNPRPTAKLVTTNTICNGDSTTMQANLTGIGPWTITWTDGFTNYTETVPAQQNNSVIPKFVVPVQAIAYTNYLTIPNSVFNPTNVFPNAPTNHYYWIIILSDAHCTAIADDITGTNLVTVNPRPTASLLSFNWTNCNDGTSFTLTNTLTGLGPWVVYWNDGFKQTNTSVSGGPTDLLRTVYPTNSFKANAPSNNVYYVTVVSNADTCLGNQPGDITGTNILTINPRPTSTLNAFNTTNCNVGQGYWLTNVLTGIGPWTNVWSLNGQTYQQVVGSVGQAGPFTNSLLVSPTNSVGANTASNNVYYVASLINGDTCSGNRPGDILGTNILTINPRPTATIIQVTNSYYSLLTFDDLPETILGIGVTNGYANLDWVNFYEVDGVNYGIPTVVVSTNNTVFNAYGNPASITDTTPFNLVSAYLSAWVTDGLQVTVLGYTNGSSNYAYSNVYTLSTNAPLFVAFNYSNVTEVDFSTPSPDWFLMDNMTIKQTGLTEKICNGSSAELQAALTGLGPWTVTWSDGHTQTTNASPGSGAVATYYVPASEVTNVFLNNTTNYTFTVTSVSNNDTCIGNQPGDLVGTASVTVSPRPTAFVSGNTNITVNGTNQYASTIQADLTGFGPWNVTWSDGVAETWTNASPAIRTVTNSLDYFVNSFTNYVYQRLRSHGSSSASSPLDSADLGSIPSPDGTNSYYTNNILGTLVVAPNINTNAHLGQWQLYPTNHSYGSGGNKRYWNYFTVQTNVITTGPTNAIVSAHFIYTVTNLTDANNECPADNNDLNGSADIFLALSATADVSTPGSTNICLGDPVQAVAIFSGTPPWTAFWSDGTTNIVYATNNPYSKHVTPDATGWFHYTITNLVDGTNGVSTNITGGIAVYVNPIPLGVPVSNGDQTNCAGNINPPLTVTDGNLVSWYDANYNLVASGTNSFIPSATDPGVYTYYAAETNSFGCAGTNVQVNLVILACTNPPVITFSGTNGVGIIQWFGNLTLESATNLVPPVTWKPVFTNPIVSIYDWYWTNGVPPWTNPYYFFRLNTN